MAALFLLGVKSALFQSRGMPSSAVRLPLVALAFTASMTGLMAQKKPDTDNPLVKVAEYHMHLARRGAAVAALGDYIYIFGGAGGSPIYQAERLDIRTGKVELLPPQFRQRVFHNAVEHDGKFHLIGGSGRSRANLPNEEVIEIYDPATNEIASQRVAPNPRVAAGAAKLGHDLLVVGGGRVNKAGSFTQTNLAEFYDLDTGAWRAAPAMPTPRNAKAVTVGQFVLVLGGYGSGGKLKTVEMFVPQEGGWKKLPDLTTSVESHSAAFLGSWIFLFGDNERSDQILAYELKSRKTLRLPPGTSHMSYSAAISHDGLIYVVGGAATSESIITTKRGRGADFRSGGETDLIQVFALNPDYQPK